MNKEVKELIEQLEEYASGGGSGLYPFEESVKALLDYINQLETNRDELKHWLISMINANEHWYNEELTIHDKKYYSKEYQITNRNLKKVREKIDELERGKE